MHRIRTHIGSFLVTLAVALPLLGGVALHFHEHVEAAGFHADARHAHERAHDKDGVPVEHDHAPVRLFLQLDAWLGGRIAPDTDCDAPASGALPAVDHAPLTGDDGNASSLPLPPLPDGSALPQTSLLRLAANLPPPVCA